MIDGRLVTWKVVERLGLLRLAKEGLRRVMLASLMVPQMMGGRLKESGRQEPGPMG